MASLTSANPYDRRARPDRGTDSYCAGPVYDILDDGRRAYPGFSLARLEELLRDEFARGFNCGEGTHEHHMEAVLPEIKRKVWAEGHVAGKLDGADDLLRTIGERFESSVAGFVQEIEGFFEAQVGAAVVDGDMALRYLVAARLLLWEMIHAHHEGFAPEAPF